MSENTYWLGFWSLATTLVIGTTWTVMHHLNEEKRMMIQAGYIQTQAPTAYTTEWVKPEGK